jgi:hypothetical protein
VAVLLQVVAFGEGHASWVSRVAFDPWLCATSSSGGPGEKDAGMPAAALIGCNHHIAAAAAVAGQMRRATYLACSAVCSF